MSIRSTIDWWIRDRTTGERVIAQRPNALVTAHGLLTVAHKTGLAGDQGETVARVADGLLAWWAADELLRGVNPLRRVIGAVVLANLARKHLR